MKKGGKGLNDRMHTTPILRGKDSPVERGYRGRLRDSVVMEGDLYLRAEVKLRTEKKGEKSKCPWS